MIWNYKEYQKPLKINCQIRQQLVNSLLQKNNNKIFRLRNLKLKQQHLIFNNYDKNLNQVMNQQKKSVLEVVIVMEIMKFQKKDLD